MSRRGIACLLAGVTIVSLSKISGSESRAGSDSGSCGTRVSLLGQVHAWAASGSIDAMAVHCNTLYVGGAFDRIGPRSGPLVVLSSATARRDKHFPEFTGGVLPTGTGLSDPRVRAIVGDGHGGFFAGGALPARADQNCSSLVHVLASGEVSRRWCPQPNGPVEALARSGSVLYVGGSFSEIGGTKRSAIAAIDTASGAVKPWDPHLRFIVSCDRDDVCDHLTEVAALAVAGRTVYAGGLFEGAADQRRPNAVALDKLTARPTAWAPAPDGSVSALLAAGRVVYIGGSFSRAGGTRRSSLAAVDAATGSATIWRAEVDGAVEALGSGPQFELYVGGNFSRVNGLSTNGFAAVDVRTGRPKRWSRGITNSGVSAVLRAGRRLYLGGSLTRLGGLTRLGIGALNLDTHRPLQWNPAANGDVAAFALVRGRVVAGGWFTAVESVQRSGLAAIDLPTGRINAWNPHLLGLVGALLAHEDTLYVGGDFTKVNGQSRRGLASFAIGSKELTSWSPQVGGGIYGVEAMALGAGSLYVGGDFESLAGRQHAAVGAIDPESGAVRSWDPRLDEGRLDREVTDLSFAGKRLYLAGEFAGVGGVDRGGVAAIDTDTGGILPWRVILNGPIGARASTVAASPDRIYVGGEFTEANGFARGGLAVLDESGKLAADAPRISGGKNLDEIMSIAVDTKQAYLAGDFRAIDGHPRPCLGAIEADGSAVSEWIPPVADWAYYAPHVLLLDGGTLFANGYISGNGEQIVALSVSGVLTGAGQ